MKFSFGSSKSRVQSDTHTKRSNNCVCSGLKRSTPREGASRHGTNMPEAYGTSVKCHHKKCYGKKPKSSLVSGPRLQDLERRNEGNSRMKREEEGHRGRNGKYNTQEEGQVGGAYMAISARYSHKGGGGDVDIFQPTRRGQWEAV